MVIAICSRQSIGRFGSLADKPSRARIHLCPLWSNSGQTLVPLDRDAPFIAIHGLI
jgi:hypothetical protein